jgi:hypothetical protein
MKSFFESAKEKLEDITEAASENINLNFLDDIKDAGIDKIKDAWHDINESTDLIRQSGYHITDISLNLSLSPTIGMNLFRVQDVSPEEIKTLMEENKNSKFMYALLLTISKANSLEKNLESGTLKFTGISIDLGLSIPKMSLKFKKIVDLEED